MGGSIFALTLAVSPVLAGELRNWSFDTTTSELTFSLSDDVFPEFFLLSEPPRLVLDIPETDIGTVELEQVYDGAVQTIRVSQYTPEQVRVVIELAPEIVLAPEQADIQFDDADGQRHWRFRPLITENTVASAAATESVGSPSSNPTSNVSLSAANLEIPGPDTFSTALPIDPYDGDASSDVVSVPPLEDSLASVPPLGDSPETAPPVAATESAALPPMVVPELEETGSDVAAMAAPTVEPEVNQSSLPAIEADAPVSSEGSIAVVPVDLPPSAEATDTVVTEAATEEDVVTGETATTTAAVMMSEPAEVEPAEVEPAEVEPAETTVATPTDVDGIAVTVPTAEIPTLEIPTETALAPVGLEPRTVAEETSSPPQTIQQPAAERTIVQTEIPAPLSFGQPLPNFSD
ncbi:MAG: AMIN domain-containing protein [Cyanobacteria bacterium P01_D01_bin.2]